MNKSDLVTVVAEKSGLTKADAAKAVDAVFEGIVESLGKGDAAAFVGFGTFKVAARPQRTGRNPATGAEMTIPASKSAKFSPGSSFKTALNPA
jgi:DNA-binding protein HU-beta